MINSQQKAKLLANWTPKAQALGVKAEVRLFDPLSSWQCYLLAINPQNDDEVLCLIKPDNYDPCEIISWSLFDIAQCYNAEGEPPQVDNEFRPREAAYLFKKLNENIYEPR